MQKTNTKINKNIKKDCSKCPDKGICLAELNVEPYYCTKGMIEKSTEKNSDKTFNFFSYVK